MNCKPGDLCMVILGPNRDRFVITREFDAHTQEWCCEALQEMIGFPEPGVTATAPAGSEVWAYDHILRPIRDQPGEDEMLRITGLPQRETA